MSNIQVDFSAHVGQVKPMHAVNNGPVYKFAEDQRITNLDAFIQAGIPYARNHDAAFNSTYGGEHCVDIYALFPDFDADPEDPASYDFVLTDELMRVYQLAGIKPFYRLGSKIEHWPKKYNTLPPKDFHKWAVICEHIIRHYNEGWADGMELGIEYWEIWNEPDLDADDSKHKRCWGGTAVEFYRLYNIAAKHLKRCFPQLKIGGPALAGNMQWADAFLAALDEDTPLDFFSWHRYSATPEGVEKRMYETDALLKKHGRGDAESICNEWNYVSGWTNDAFLDSLRKIKQLKGASFTAAVMALCQKGPMDMLMYYDAQPSGFNGLFSTDFVCDRLKGYYPFYMFNKLYQLRHSVDCQADEGLYAVAAHQDGESAVMFTHFSDDDTAPDQRVTLSLSGLCGKKTVKVYLLDEHKDLELVSEFRAETAGLELVLNAPVYSCYLITMD